MATLQELLTEINGYPDGNVALQVTLDPVPFRPGETPDAAINVGETRSFRVKVTNDGDLHMKNLKLLVEGSKWADVAASSAADTELFKSDFVSSPLDVDAHSSTTFGPFSPLALSKTNNGDKKIVRSHIRTFDADLDYILAGRRHEAETPEAAMEVEVFPS